VRLEEGGKKKRIPQSCTRFPKSDGGWSRRRDLAENGGGLVRLVRGARRERFSMFQGSLVFEGASQPAEKMPHRK